VRLFGQFQKANSANFSCSAFSELLTGRGFLAALALLLFLNRVEREATLRA
jgi:hypothetical protein